MGRGNWLSNTTAHLLKPILSIRPHILNVPTTFKIVHYLGTIHSNKGICGKQFTFKLRKPRMACEKDLEQRKLSR